MQTTTIQITIKTKNLLDSAKKYRRETYNDMIQRLLEEAGYVRKEGPKTTQAVRQKPSQEQGAEIEY